MKRVFFFPDMHVPYHDNRATNLAIKAAKQFKPDIVVMLGDVGDFYAVSRHIRTPDRERLLKREISSVKAVLKKIEEINASEYIFIAGNHEHRLNRYLCEKAPELYGMLEIPDILDIQDWDYVPYGEGVMLGKLYVTHDVGYSGKSALQQSQAALGGSIIIGHTHRMGSTYPGFMDGTRLTAQSFGWLGDFRAITEYKQLVRARREWCHGFGVAHIEDNGYAHVRGVPIFRNRCVVDGKLIQL